MKSKRNKTKRVYSIKEYEQDLERIIKDWPEGNKKVARLPLLLGKQLAFIYNPDGTLTEEFKRAIISAGTKP